MEVICPLCGEKVVHESMGFYCCPLCGCEIWPKDPFDDLTSAIREDMRRGERGKGSGGSKGRRKKRPQPPMASERYMLW
jgi:hypothetical protein